jgi:5'-methylthioadenosine phosphorylase
VLPNDPPVLGIIGGSGLYALDALSEMDTLTVETPYGRPFEPVRVGTLGATRVAFISRHGAGHALSPSEIPFAANICALKMLGVRQVVSISAVGSLREEIPPRSFVVPDQTIDRTVGRRRTFFGDGAVAHVSMADPFCPSLSDALANAALVGGLPVHRGGTYVCIEGPQFSSKAESALFRSWGAGIIGMTALPEARLAREAELCYACLAMVSDYDVWHDTEQAVSVDAVIANVVAMTSAVGAIVNSLAIQAPVACAHGCESALRNAIVTNPSSIPADARARLMPIAGRYLEQGR